MVRWIAMALLAGVIVSCTERPPVGTRAEYFDVDSLLTQERSFLSTQNKRLRKQVQLGDSIDVQVLPADSITFSEELKIFEAINPSQNRYTNAFDIIKEGADVVYRHVDPFAELRQVTLNYVGEDLSAIEGIVSEKTAIYTSYRAMSLRFAEGHLTSYAVSGFQKMLFSDTVFFQVETLIQN